MNKKSLSERDICSKFISPAIASAGWDLNTQLREEVALTSGSISGHWKKSGANGMSRPKRQRWPCERARRWVIRRTSARGRSRNSTGMGRF